MSETTQIDLGRTPLHMAALADDWKLAETLIEAGADVNAQDNQGNTPMNVALGLHRGEKTMDMDKSIFWISQGANPSITNENGVCVWWQSTPAAQNNMVGEMRERDHRLSVQTQAQSWSPDPAEADRKFDQAFKDASSKAEGSQLRQSGGAAPMRALALLPLLILAACTGGRQEVGTAPHISPLAHDLAVCAIAARESTSWPAEERLARSMVNASAAARVLLKDQPSIDAPTAQATIKQLIKDPSIAPEDPEAWYLAECV